MLSNSERLLFWPIKGNIVINQAWVYSDGTNHNGIDIRCYNMPLFPCEPGVVSRVQYWDGKTISVKSMQSYGNMVEVTHEDYEGKTLVTRYAHLSSIAVKPGDSVNYGKQIGVTGDTGNVTGSHLHLEVILNGRRTNPMLWLGPDYICKTAVCRNNLFRTHSGTVKGHSVRWIGERAILNNIPSTTAVGLFQAFKNRKYIAYYTNEYENEQNLSFRLLNYEDMDTIREILWK